MELLRITREIHCKAVEQRAMLIHRQYNRDWGWTSYSRPPIDPYLTSPLLQNPGGATGNANSREASHDTSSRTKYQPKPDYIRTHTHTHTHTHPFNGHFSGTTQVSPYQKGKTNLDFTGARDSEWQWHQLGRMQVCTSLQTYNHASTSPLSFLQTGCPSCRPTNSVEALKA